MSFLRHVFAASIATIVLALPSHAQSNWFGDGWTLDGQASSLHFQSIKNGSVIETSSFATLRGAISPDGTAEIKVLLDSVDTNVDLRNVRMRFLFFETFLHPEATVTAWIDPALVADLATVRRKTVSMPFNLELHGVTKTLNASLALTLIGDDLVAVSSAEPINIATADFGLSEGVLKLEEAANVKIVPSSSVNFDFIFRGSAGTAPAPPATAANTNQQTTSAALETSGDFSSEACVGRFEILSRTNINFSSGSARLSQNSYPLLDQVVDIVSRCPKLNVVVAGHTDSVGASDLNQRLSERRAASVVNYLTQNGISHSRLNAVGYGEDRPVADNNTDRGRFRNRRIEFSAAGG